MENSDPEEEEEEEAAAEKLLDDEYNKVADKKEDTDFRINEDREVVLVDDADDDDVDAALVVVLAATVFTANIVLFPSSTSDLWCTYDVNSRAFPYVYFFPGVKKKRKHPETINNMLPAALNRKPCRRALVLFLVLVIIPFSGRMFYLHKLEFARRVSLRLEEARRVQNSTTSLAMKMRTFQNEDDDDDKEKREQKQQQQLHEDEEKRLLEGNPLGDA